MGDFSCCFAFKRSDESYLYQFQILGLANRETLIRWSVNFHLVRLKDYSKGLSYESKLLFYGYHTTGKRSFSFMNGKGTHENWIKIIY